MINPFVKARALKFHEKGPSCAERVPERKDDEQEKAVGRVMA